MFYNNSIIDPNDIHLVSKDQELNFSEKPEEDDDKDGSKSQDKAQSDLDIEP